MPTLVLLPGMDGTGDLFAPLLALLPPDITPLVVRYPDQAQGYDALIAHARAAIPEQGDVVLLGESFSGPVAVALAAEGNPRLRGLVLSATFVTNPMPWTRPLLPLLGVLPVTGGPAALLTRAVLGAFNGSGRGAMVDASLAQMSAPTIRARLRAIAAVDCREQLSRVTVPVLYLRAEHDRVVPASATRVLAELKPEMKIVPCKAPHFLLQVATEEAAPLIVDFVRDVAPAGKAL